MRGVRWRAAAALGLVLGLTATAAAASRPLVYRLRLADETINPATAQYIISSLDRAAGAGADAVVLMLDTPGGLLASTRAIVRAFLSSSVPVVVYIAPPGARAGSAGVFLTYAAHVAAMAPSTNIGAAHPVTLGGGGGRGSRRIWKDLKDFLRGGKKSDGGRPASEREPPANRLVPPTKETTSEAEDAGSSGEEAEEDAADPMADKILQDTTAFIRALARRHGRNVEWAVRSVVRSESITEEEARDLGVVDLIAGSLTELLARIDGRPVETSEGPVVLHTEDARVVTVEMDARQKFLNVLANPNIAYLFMILGFYGLLYEVTHPGFGLPGVLGSVFLVLALYSMQTLPTNYAGLALTLLGLGLFVAEAFVPGFGVLALGGGLCMILGGVLLFGGEEPFMAGVSLEVILPLTLGTAVVTVLLVRMVFKAHRRKAVSGREGMVGETGIVRRAIPAGGEGKVFVHGGLWNARADGGIPEGGRVRVVGVEGLLLVVEPVGGPRSGEG